MTPEEASKKWCPFVRVPIWGSPANLVVNRDDKGHPTNLMTCVADLCMAWRWVEVSKRRTGEGYCGLAGKEGG